VMESANVAFIANQNFLWPTFMGLNRNTEEIAAFMAARGRSLGFERAERVLFDSDPSRYIDVYTRPTVSVKLKYLRHNDKWLDAETALVLRTAGATLDDYKLDIDVMVPGVNDPAFALPLTAVLVGPAGAAGPRTAIVRHAGPARLTFSLDGLAAGEYRLQFDKTFSSAADPRRLAAVFVDARVRYAARK
jgi:hypothetical protein